MLFCSSVSVKSTTVHDLLESWRRAENGPALGQIDQSVNSSVNKGTRSATVHNVLFGARAGILPRGLSG
jgi:hypothetical protein